MMDTQKKYYVYCFYNEDWQEIFYIGKGTGYRWKSTNDRNPHVKSILEHHNCTMRILVGGLTEQDALTKEAELKKLYKANGSPIIDYEQHTGCQIRAGIERAKKQGKYKGRQPIKVDAGLFNAVYARWKDGEITAVQAQKELGLKPDTFYRRVKKYKQENNQIT